MHIKGHNLLIALVGLPGSGKSMAANFFEQYGFSKIRFGELTDKELEKNNLEQNEENEKRIREFLRKKYGMHVYALLNKENIQHELKLNNVIIDGLYSLEEYTYLKKEFPQLIVIAIYAPPDVRYDRLAQRTIRPLKLEDAMQRDLSQIEKLHQGGPIAMADYTIPNIDSPEKLREYITEVLALFS